MTRRTSRRATLALGLLGTGLASCGHQPELHPAASPAAQRHELQVAGRTVTVELALTHDEQMLGLMHRAHLDPEAGMLFIFKDDQPRTFWMKDTLIPLDIIFLEADGTVQNVARGEPMVEVPGVYSVGPARMVLELNAGWCAEHGLKAGDRIPVPPELLALGQE
jgi:uncharacterized membrane protein (UPF0127 family)